MQRRVIGSVVGVVCAVAFGALLLPFRSDVGGSTTALVLVIPVVVGTLIGGFGAGAASVVAGFLVYDFAFVRPYWTLSVGTSQNWTALVVYVVVMLLVVRVVDVLETTRSEARRARDYMRRVSEVSELLVGEQPLDELLKTIVTTAMTAFNVPGASLLELENGRLVVVASVGEPLSANELRQLEPRSGQPVSVGTSPASSSALRTVALTSSGRAVGILAMRSIPIEDTDRDLLNTFANDAALALERAQLREQALRTKLLEEADRFRRGLLGAVSHDLRTPLATIKVASSTLTNRAGQLTQGDTVELYRLIELESDRLTRLVTNLLDMTRIEAGVLTPRLVGTPVSELVKESVGAMGASLRDRRVDVAVPDSLPEVVIDPVLMGQVLVNLLDNALRHGPAGSVITLSAEDRDGVIVVAVADQGPGVAPDSRESIFDRFTQLSTGGRAGLGLTIAKTFVEAHGERIWYEETPEGGARFVLSLPQRAPRR